ncbi:hypothetical protein BST97_04175 [Nonlabens spongiae]|uniref:DUF3999 domain-containing protein n=1 Tax=Nonlabens spongiae TaxID=331648 RepID=A0A1W6MI14_9FLAO|nr:DUF3999 family protein [Nonlabens spongiae]ARN77241.1 hypothetical protein BST97_04175 [Nonlabens spongiae]
MKQQTSLLYLLIFSIFSSWSYGQMHDYDYKRELSGISETWHKIVLSDEVFGKASKDLLDLRIYGVKDDGKIIEVPYLLLTTRDQNISKKVTFETLNVSENENGYYFTFKIPTSKPVNHIDLDFAQENFDWRVTLEGSQDQQEWFKIVEDQRILSIRNTQTDFQFTELDFASAKYQYFRLLAKSEQQPDLKNASITQNEDVKGKKRNYQLKRYRVKENIRTQQTEIDVELKMPVRVSEIKLKVSDDFDYYRSMAIKYLTDSVKTEKGWHYNYRIFTRDNLNSLEENTFTFPDVTAQRLKIIIDNQDNQPLNIEEIQVQGPFKEMIARFTEEATYFLTYGNQDASSPYYDIQRFDNKIPEDLSILELGNEQTISKQKSKTASPLFENQSWLWIVMALIIGVLGWFSFRMMKKG